jgi:hypothetical protein
LGTVDELGDGVLGAKVASRVLEGSLGANEKRGGLGDEAAAKPPDGEDEKEKVVRLAAVIGVGTDGEGTKENGIRLAASVGGAKGLGVEGVALRLDDWTAFPNPLKMSAGSSPTFGGCLAVRMKVTSPWGSYIWMLEAIWLLQRKMELSKIRCLLEVGDRMPVAGCPAALAETATITRNLAESGI